MDHVVSAFASENKLVLANLGVSDKENEITAIPKLLAMIDLQGSTVTIDAVGCQREIARQITEAKGDYVLQVKDNQPTLHKKVRALLDEAILDQMKGWKGSASEEVDAAGHGRLETPAGMAHHRGPTPGRGPVGLVAEPQGDRGHRSGAGGDGQEPKVFAPAPG